MNVYLSRLVVGDNTCCYTLFSYLYWNWMFIKILFYECISTKLRVPFCKHIIQNAFIKRTKTKPKLQNTEYNKHCLQKLMVWGHLLSRSLNSPVDFLYNQNRSFCELCSIDSLKRISSNKRLVHETDIATADILWRRRGRWGQGLQNVRSCKLFHWVSKQTNVFFVLIAKRV